MQIATLRMRKLIINSATLLSLLLCTGITTICGQQKLFFHDNEKIFTATEIKQVDSVLRNYHQKTGNHVLVLTTDTLDGLGPEEYAIRFARQQPLSNTQNQKGFIFLMSRKNQLLYLVASDPLKALVSREKLMEIINEGIPALKEKRTAEGLVQICKKAMECLNKL